MILPFKGHDVVLFSFRNVSHTTSLQVGKATEIDSKNMLPDYFEILPEHCYHRFVKRSKQLNDMNRYSNEKKVYKA